MLNKDFETLRQLALLDVVAGIERFGAARKHKAVYAIALSVIGGDWVPALSVNTESDAEPCGPGEALDVEQERFNSFTFKYRDEEVFSEDTVSLFEKFRAEELRLSRYQDSEECLEGLEDQQKIDRAFDQLYDKYFGCLFSVLRDLEGFLADLDLAPNCVRYVDLGNNDGDSRERHLRATIPSNLFNQIFPHRPAS